MTRRVWSDSVKSRDGGQIPALVVLLGQVVEADQQAEHDHHADDRERAVAGLPLGEGGGHLAPLAGGVEEDAGEAGEREALAQRDQVVAEEPGGDAGEDQGDARPAEDVGDATEHMCVSTRATVRRPRCARSGTGRT